MAMAFEPLADVLNGDLFDGGDMPLTDHHAEELLIGFLLAKPEAVTETLDIVRPHDLHDPLHRRICELLYHAYEIAADYPPSMEKLVACVGGEKSAAATIARLAASADLSVDIGEIADHLQIISERRAIGIDADGFDNNGPLASKFGALAWEDIGAAGSVDGYSWFVEEVFPMGEISLIFGDTGSGKSFNMFDVAMCGARGIPFNGCNVEPGLVVYVAAEAGKGFSKRKIAYVVQHGLDPSEPLPFVLLTKRPDFFHDDTDAVGLIEEIKQICGRYRQRLVCVILDTLSALAPGMNENASADVSMVRKRLVMLQEAFEASIILVHHKPKGGSTPRGHGSLTADFETTVEFETATDKRTSTGQPIHRATVRKQREGKSGRFWEFTLPVVEVGRNKWGNPETSCAVQPFISGQQRAGAIGFHATPTEQRFLTALYDALIDQPLPPPAGLPKSISKVADLKVVRQIMRDRTIAPHEDNAISDNRFRAAFKRAGDKLRDGAVIGVQGGLAWPTGKAVNGFTGPQQSS